MKMKLEKLEVKYVHILFSESINTVNACFFFEKKSKQNSRLHIINIIKFKLYFFNRSLQSFYKYALFDNL